MITDQEWTAHVEDSQRRDASLESSIAELSSVITGLRITVESFANKNAQLRESARLARIESHAPSPDGIRGPMDTHDHLLQVSTETADSVLQGVDNLSLWKRAPELVSAVAGPAIGVAVAFGVVMTEAQKNAVYTLLFVIAGIAAKVAIDMAAHGRSKRTRKTMVRAMTAPKE